MYKNKRILALIPARGGSKGIPYKNIKILCKKPLISWTIGLLKEIPEIDKAVVSTDDLNISIVSQFFGADVIERPGDISADYSQPVDAVLHTLTVLKERNETYDIILYLQPTSPLRSKEDIYACLDLLIDNKERYTSAATFTEADTNPVQAWKMEGSTPTTYLEGANPFLPRQKLPRAYQLAGSVYAFFTDTLKDKSVHFLGDRPGGIIIPNERAVDIDDEADFCVAEHLLERRIFGSDL
ncbi:acylneuraminate cytidylyltransferase family protein [Metabacillus sp. cB07]|uniref:acylneuraminate cytidylyltransferase family protein n=1 Tax=Metabacillus sp. cB07 TaxID=2806989 RepID=UPI00193A9215|nr:acylneuraminate cytidylyltransferase family protein [Metabacillus sp. cB07]